MVLPLQALMFVLSLCALDVRLRAAHQSHHQMKPLEMALWEPEPKENEMAGTDTKDSKTVTVGGDLVTVSSVPGWKNWRTLIFGALLVLFGGIQASDLATIVPAEWTGVVMAVIGAVVMILRSMTSGPAGSDLSVNKV
jgi:hypothetical protein